MNEITMPGWTALTVGQPLEGPLDPEAPHIGIDACGRFVVLNVVQTRSRDDDIRHFNDGLRIGSVQRGPVVMGMINGGIGGDNVVIPCNCQDCSLPYLQGSHDVWQLVLAHRGEVSALRVATTSSCFSRVFRKSLQRVVPSWQCVDEMGLTSEAYVHFARLRSLSPRQLWRMADATSRFGG